MSAAGSSLLSVRQATDIASHQDMWPPQVVDSALRVLARHRRDVDTVCDAELGREFHRPPRPLSHADRLRTACERILAGEDRGRLLPFLLGFLEAVPDEAITRQVADAVECAAGYDPDGAL